MSTQVRLDAIEFCNAAKSEQGSSCGAYRRFMVDFASNRFGTSAWTSGRPDVGTSGRPDVRTSGRPGFARNLRRDAVSFLPVSFGVTVLGWFRSKLPFLDFDLWRCDSEALSDVFGCNPEALSDVCDLWISAGSGKLAGFAKDFLWLVEREKAAEWCFASSLLNNQCCGEFGSAMIVFFLSVVRTWQWAIN